jgi:hypothetical protein
MLDVSHKLSHAQRHKVGHRLSIDLILLQDLTLSHHHQIEQIIDHELSQNPALEVIQEPSFLEDAEPKERDDDWNEDYGKPIDEYETGDPSTSEDSPTWDSLDISENLYQAAIQRFSGDPERLEHALQSVDCYRVHGSLPEDAAPQLHEDLVILERSLSHQTLPQIHPTFEVTVRHNRVEAHVLNMGTNLRYKDGLGSHTKRAMKFIQLLNDSNRILNELGRIILSELQRDFFLQNNLDAALCHLVPIPISLLSRLRISAFKIDKRYLSKLGDHLVSCVFGAIPFNCFMQEKAALVRLWIKVAQHKGISTRKDQCNWINGQIREWVGKWAPVDRRHEVIGPMGKITINDIKYAERVLK